MIARLAAALVVLAVPVAAQRPVFRTSADSVLVDVSVRQRGVPVPNLTALDFRLTDNGDVQTILDISRETLPVDVTLVLDLSGRSEGPALNAVRRAVATVTARLRERDQSCLVVFDHRVHEVCGFESSHLTIASDVPEFASGSSAFVDALAASLVRPLPPGRRQVAIVLTSGQDELSFLDEPALIEVAARSGVTVFVVALTDGTSRVPQPPPNPAVLRRLTETTGGALVVLQRDQDLGASFVQALDDFRTSYLLSYTPTAPSTGWHELNVAVTRRGQYDVRARKGYFGN